MLNYKLERKKAINTEDQDNLSDFTQESRHRKKEVADYKDVTEVGREFKI